jgi:hypothetical protein
LRNFSPAARRKFPRDGRIEWGWGGEIVKKFISYFIIFMGISAFCPILIPILAILAGVFLLWVVPQVIVILLLEFISDIVAKVKRRQAIKHAKEMGWIE